MSNINLDNIDSMQVDVLKEIGNIGAGNATTALSTMVNGKVDMNVPKVALLEFKDLPDTVGGAENIVVGILITLEGEINGMMMFMMEQKSAYRLVNILLGKPPEDESFTEMELSALKEIGNIIAGAYLSSLSTLTGIRIDASVPYMSIDMAGAILSVPAIEFGKVGDKALIIETQFSKDDSDVNGYFILIPSLESYGVILSSLGL
ncbi:chemotaxis protein CheC [Anaerocolumna cellulosilytica]|uniref:Chemotaxis protein CheC n=1 Tax=Anaerocolumna cellulosilytica TaxID=433286 RepID=A0A6S6R8F6_9FIRM|nr:chemotaxis protein CheC [Anaerocolumna cellulosilytica]MBB5197007.1 chemotaxis protein CheC [Anaerocolumna cellulosilytica]BCJ95221.1 chemotaxis protein CheC [Anaerocolumna cellulosilytica]